MKKGNAKDMSRRNDIVIFLCLLVIGGLYTLKIRMEQLLLPVAVDLYVVTEEIDMIKRENDKLKLQILEEKAFTTIKRKADEQGYIEIKNRYIIKAR